VYVIADGVSSCNKEEVPIALARLRHEGATVTTSESFLYECVGDAGTPEYVYAKKLLKSGVTAKFHAGSSKSSSWSRKAAKAPKTRCKLYARSSVIFPGLTKILRAANFTNLSSVTTTGTSSIF
jgi:hypothetical protein